MHREFLDFYNRELQLLYEQAGEFAEEYPGIAERLGGLVGDRTDPMIAGLLEGAAFLAARVQLKLKHEFPEFTNNLLEQLVPNYLAPTPSALLAKVVPPYGDPALREGQSIPRGSYLDATYVERDRRIACRYCLSSEIVLWPFEIAGAEYFGAPGPLQALGVPVTRNAIAGMRLSLTHRTAGSAEAERPDAEVAKLPEFRFTGCRTTELPIYLVGGEADSIALYEQLFAHCAGIFFRYLDEFGDPVVIRAPEGCISQVGLEEGEALLPTDARIFRGFDLLREYFMFPRKFLGFKLTRLAPVMARLPARSVDVLFVFDEVNTRLSAAVAPSMFALYAAAAVNLFEKTADRIPVAARHHEYHLVPDRSRYLDFEPHRILEVYAHYAGGHEKVPVHPLYSAPEDGTDLFYTMRRAPRRRTAEERQYGTASDYTGTDVFISLVEPADLEDLPAVAELSVRALCSNRHLTEHLPVGDGGTDFRLLDNVTLDIRCVAGPTPPREPVLAQLRSRTETAHTGAVAWRLINMLSLNHLGLVERGAGHNGQSLRQILTLLADASESAVERRLRGIRSIESRPIVRRFRERSGMGAARGLEVTISLDEKAFQGSGVFLLGAVLERFFAEYAAMNHFTQTVIRTLERGEIMRWPPRHGTRRPL